MPVRVFSFRDPESSKLSRIIRPFNLYSSNDCSSRTDMAESNQLVQSSLLPLSQSFHSTVMKIFHPSRDSESSSMIGDFPSEEDSLYQTGDQNSCSGFHSPVRERRSISLLLQAEQKRRPAASWGSSCWRRDDLTNGCSKGRERHFL